MTAAKIAAHDAVHDIYRDHHGWMRAWFLRKLPSADDAEELAQDAFLRIVAGRARFDFSQPRALLTTIARGLVADHYRRQTLEQAFLDGLALVPEQHAPSAEDRALVLETLNALDIMLDGLPPKVRRAFLLSRLDGWPYESIARELAVTVSSVKKYIAQALLRCYQSLYDV